MDAGDTVPASLAVVGGTVVTDGRSERADVVVDGGTVKALARPEVAHGTVEQLDAAGCYVLPGGVDAHCHLMSDVVAATRAAAIGGTTTVLSFTNPEREEGALSCLHRRQDELRQSGSAVDIGLHSMLYVPDHPSLAEMQALAEAGTCGVKIFLAYPELGIMWSTKGLLELMAMAAQRRQILQVHCEDGEMIEGLLEEAARAGLRGPAVFAETRPAAAEAASVALVAEMAALTGARCYLVHLSSGEALDFVRVARRHSSVPLAAEVCLHHLLLDDRHHHSAEAERYLVCPPLRSSDQVRALWAGISERTVDVVASDHAQERSRTTGELSEDGTGYRYGLAGVGPRLPLLLSEGLARGHAIEHLVELASTAPARIFGLYPRKGTLSPGSDGDLVVYEPSGAATIEPDTFDDGTGDSPYAGISVAGRIRHVVLRGRVIVRDGTYLDGERTGELVRPLRLSPRRA